MIEESEGNDALPPATEPPEAAEIEPAGGIVRRPPAPGTPPAPDADEPSAPDRPA